MASKDLNELRDKLFNEKYEVLSVDEKYDATGDAPSIKATVILEKDGNQVSIQSSEVDFFMYVNELRGVANTEGKHEFIKVKNANQYNQDVDHLIDFDRSKVKRAVEEINSKKFVREYIASKLVDEFLENKRNVKYVKYLPLKSDYHYIKAAALIEAKRTLKKREQLIGKFPGAKVIIEATEQIFTSFRASGNGISDYQLYRSYVTFDIDALLNRVSAQLPAMDDTVKEFIKRGKLEPNIAIPKIINIYSRMLELSSPIINLLRVGLELKRGVSSPSKYYNLKRNLDILKSDTEYGSLFSCLDEQIRHSDAHVSITIDKAHQEINLIDARGRKAKIVRTYKFDELLRMSQVMEYELFPALIFTIILHDIAMLVLLLESREYLHLLLAIGNC
ncbi:MAG: hypothetical protein HQ577_03665 [Dehalococcoidia bacterium]|nr:hypothetical protein [Dehalococcoidia bacterium]